MELDCLWTEMHARLGMEEGFGNGSGWTSGMVLCCHGPGFPWPAGGPQGLA